MLKNRFLYRYKFGVPFGEFVFRVKYLDVMIAQIETAGTPVKLDEELPIGRFAKLADLEGNPIELWEPKVA